LNHTRHTTYSRRPASWHGELWREAMFMGNGLSGALVRGSIAEEVISFNRFDLWHGGSDTMPIPDVSEAFHEMRRLIEEGRYTEANTNILQKALWDAGFASNCEVPHPLGKLHMCFEPEAIFTDYERGIDMRRGEGFVNFKIGGVTFERRFFVSRSHDLFVMRIKSELPFEASYRFEVYETGNAVPSYELSERGISALSGDKTYGSTIRFDGDITSEVKNDRVHVTGSDYTVVMRLFSHGSRSDIGSDLDYASLLKAHEALHTPLYDAVSIELDSGDDVESDAPVSNEALLDEAYIGRASPMLIERLWRFGRYLFISAAAEGGNPIPLYGLWHGDDNLPWAQYVANENVQITYAHAVTGGLAWALKPLVRYYTAKTARLRECAKQLFGCRGIWLSAYTTPNVSGPCVPVGVIINWISGAPWICRHFWEYYTATGDEAMLREEILPFMREAALFLLDYVTYDESGRAKIIPSVSPENTPENLMPPYATDNLIHVAPAVKNSTMDFALAKELLTHLLCGIEKTGMYADEAEDYRRLLGAIPDYMVNTDGALKEWMDEGLDDRYYHRHLSHLYPLFPGDEITPDDAALYEACGKAVRLRIIGGQSGWTMPHMAAIYARLGEGEKAAGCFDIMAKSILNGMLVTTHNDWRHMGMTLDQGDNFAPVQLDALFGAVGALQEMLFRCDGKALHILPALPERFRSGRVRGLVFASENGCGTVDIEWNGDDVSYTVHGDFGGRVYVMGELRTLVQNDG